MFKVPKVKSSSSVSIQERNESQEFQLIYCRKKLISLFHKNRDLRVQSQSIMIVFGTQLYSVFTCIVLSYIILGINFRKTKHGYGVLVRKPPNPPIFLPTKNIFFLDPQS